MSTNLALFRGVDASIEFGLWETDGTSAGTWEISVAGSNPTGLNPGSLTTFGNEVLFVGSDANNNFGLWVTDGTSPGTSELALAGGKPVIFGSEVLFNGGFFGNLWVTDGTPAGTSQISVPGAASDGLDVSGLTVFGNEVLFSGQDTSGHYGLWVTDGTSAGTSELQVTGANWSSLGPSNLTVLPGKVLFTAPGTGGTTHLWVTDGTSAGTSELSVSVAGALGGPFGWPSGSFVVLGSEVLFDGFGAGHKAGLWVTDGTSAGTSEIMAGDFFDGLSGGLFDLAPPHFIAFGSEVLFEGANASGRLGLWITDGTSAGTSELSVTGAAASGIFLDPPSFFVFGSEVLFEGFDSSARRTLWVTNGTAAGTSELSVAGADTTFGIFATEPPNFGLFGSEVLFNGRDAHGLNGLWATDGTAAGTLEISVAGAGTRDGLGPDGITAFTQNLIRPALSNVPGSEFYAERSAPVTLAPSLRPNDDNSTTLSNATVSIVGGTFAGDGDVLAFSTAGTSITASYNSSTETLTLTGADTLANYRLVLDSITFASPSHNPTNFGSDPTRVLTWVADDGTASNNLSIPQITTLSITAVNDPPMLSNVATIASFTEEGGAVTLSSAVTVTDPDDLDLASATVAITGGMFTGDGDVLAATTTGTNITASYHSSTETLTLSGTDSLAHYQQVLDTVTFTAGENPTDYGSNPTRSITWTLMDPSGTLNGGSNVSTPVTTAVSITNLNDPPTLSNVAATATVRGVGQIVTLSPALAVSDPDNLTLASATVAIIGGTFANDGDMLAASTAGTAITASYNSSTEMLTLSGADTPAHYSQALDSITFSSGASPINSVAHPTRTLTWMVNDGSASNNLSTAVTTTISISLAARNDFNGDGSSDLLFQNTNGTPQIWLMNGTSIVSQTALPQPPASWTVIGTGDFNGDGRADIIWQNSDGTPAIWEMSGTSIVSAVALIAPPSSWHIIATGDFNGDGKADILWQNTNGQPAIWEMNGTSIINAVGLATPPASWRVIGTGDFDSDGHADILWQNSDGTPAIWEMNGTSVVSAVAPTAPSPQSKIVGTGDFDGDGKSDILWVNTVSNAPTIWEMNGTSIVATATLPAPPSSWTLIGTSDVNADGHADILWQNSDGTPAIWAMNGTTIVSAVALPSPGAAWLIKNDGPIPADQMGTAAPGDGQPNNNMHQSAPDMVAGSPALNAPAAANRAGDAANGASALGGSPPSGPLDPSMLNNQHPMFGMG